MADKLLVSTDFAVTKIGISQQIAESVDDSLKEALLSAQRRIERELDVSLQAGTVLEIFKLDKDAFSGIQPGGYYRLYLKSGLLSAAPSVYLGISVDGEAIPATNLGVNLEKGIVHVKAEAGYDDQYVTVSSAFGYTSASQLPEWMRDAICSYAPAMFSANASDNSEDPKKDYQVMVDHAMAILAPYRRSIGFAFRPIF